MVTTAAQWLQQFAARLNIEPPAPEQVDELLALAGIAAHASERTAAPVSCWLAASARRSPAEALAVARALADELEDAPADGN